MSKQQLPPDPSFEQLKKQAKDLQAAVRAGEAEAAARVRASHPDFGKARDADVVGAKLNLRAAQLVIAREYGFGTWQELKAQVDGRGSSVTELQQLASETPDEVARVLRLMLDEPEQAATFLYALGQQTTSDLMRYLSDREIEVVIEAIAALGDVSEAQGTQALADFDRLRRAGASTKVKVKQSNADFAFGALAGAVGRRKANEIFGKHQLSASAEMAHPALKPEYLAKKAALLEKLSGMPTAQMGLDELRQTLVGLAEVARAEGIITFEAFVPDAADLENLLHSGLTLIVDGTEPDVVHDLLTTEMESLVRSYETRCRMVIAAVADIQAGQNPRLIDHKLSRFYEPQRS